MAAHGGHYRPLTSKFTVPFRALMIPAASDPIAARGRAHLPLFPTTTNKYPIDFVPVPVHAAAFQFSHLSTHTTQVATSLAGPSSACRLIL